MVAESPLALDQVTKSASELDIPCDEGAPRTDTAVTVVVTEQRVVVE
jgi:hypothetical protein